MRQFLLTTILLVVSQMLHAQSVDKNYVKSETYINNNGGKITSVQYYDGLGRPCILVTNSMSTKGSYSYSLQTYDADSRGADTWLPGVNGSSPSFVSLSKAQEYAKSSFSDTAPYTHQDYDALDRTVTILGPGQAWHSKSKAVKKSYTSNKASSVKRYNYSESKGLVSNGYYAAGTLRAETTTDEDGRSITIFTNFVGQKVLERRSNNNDTYFVYDDFGELRYVLTPMYQEKNSLDAYAYEYRYDERSHCVYKKIPGCDPVNYWYDSHGRLAFMQDGVLRASKRFRFMLYDCAGRLVVQGTCSNRPTNIVDAIAEPCQNLGLCNSGYQVSGISLNSPKLENAYYYDNYDFLSRPAFTNSGKASALKANNTSSAPGSQTGSIINTTNGELLYGVTYYNLKGLPTDSRQSQLDGKFLFCRTSYSFTDKPVRAVYELRQGTRIDSIVSVKEYSKVNDAHLTTSISYNGGTAHQVEKCEYDNLGRLTTKTRPGSAGKVDYTYNVRNWLTKINGLGFSEELFYDTGLGTSLFSGNISSVKWKAGSSDVQRGYIYTYDNLGRLTNAKYGEGTSLTSNVDRYSEGSLSYSSNGAITGLKRYGKRSNGSFGLIDNLTISLDGNRISTVKDAAGSQVYNNSFDFKKGTIDKAYGYNNNGALIYDPDKGMTLTYDQSEKLQKIDFGGNKSSQYIYSNDGKKLKVSYISGSVTSTIEYVGPFLLTNGQLDKFLFNGGYSTLANKQATFHYYTQDHLGNNRAVVNESGKVEQITHYYPFGGVYGDLSTNPSAQPYKYNGKEFDHQHGLDWYDYGARHYDPALARWDRLDPLCEKYYSVSPYNYCLDNPVWLLDPDGLDPTTKEAALIADDVYKPCSGTLEGGWRRVITKSDGINAALNNSDSGFKSALYGRWDAEKQKYTEYVYATAGTDLTSKKDWKNNFSQLMGESEQYRQSVENAKDLNKYFSGATLTFVGHSLGGGLASANSLATGRNAITFNAAGLSDATKKTLGLNNTTGKIDAYIVAGEALNNAQAVIGLKAEGNIHTICVPIYIDAVLKPSVARLVLALWKHTMGCVTYILK